MVVDPVFAFVTVSEPAVSPGPEVKVKTTESAPRAGKLVATNASVAARRQKTARRDRISVNVAQAHGLGCTCRSRAALTARISIAALVPPAAPPPSATSGVCRWAP